MKIIKDLVIMAAGRGMRMMPLTADIPKPMIPIWGSTLISYGISQLSNKVENIHVTAGYKGALLAEHVMELGVSSVFNTNEHGNAWWIYNTLLRYLDSPIFVLTCDNLVELDFYALEDNYIKHEQPACMVVPVKPVKGLDGDYVFHNENVVSKLDRHEKSDYYCSGVQILNPFKVNQLTDKVEDFNDLWSQLIEKKQVFVSDIIPDKWYAVDTINQLLQVKDNVIWKK